MAEKDPDEQLDQKADGIGEEITADAGQTADVQQEPAGTDSLLEQLEAALAQVDSLKDQALRGQAEAENARRRAGRDVENAHKFALEKFAGDLLPVVDSLEKALESAAVESGPIAEGVGLSLKLFLDVLERAGVSRIDPQGEPFDPQRHEAMAMIEHPDSEPNSVIEVMQIGYVLNDRLLRAAMVVVSKAPAAASDGDE